jgi:DNA-binding transcriptional LysR family regulator
MTAQAGIGDLEIGLLRMFVAVVECGSMGRAAAAVEMTQPAVSQQMLRLETIVGQKLFTRGRNGIALTSDGELLVKYAGRVLDLNNEILLRFRRDRSQSPVALGVSGGIGMAGLSSSLRRFQNLQPHSELRVLTAPPSKIEALLTSGDLHLGVAEPSAMRRNPLAKWPVQLAWAAPRRFRIEQFRAVPLVLFEGPCPWQDNLLDSLRDAGREWHVVFESTSMDAILAATQSGLGIAVLPTEFVRNSRLVPFTHPVLPAAPRVEFGLFGASALPSSARTLLEVVQSCASATN